MLLLFYLGKKSILFLGVYFFEKEIYRCPRSWA